MGASNIKAGEAFVEISAKKGILDKVLGQARNSLKSFASSAIAIGKSIPASMGSINKGIQGVASKLFNLKNAIVGSFAVAGIGKMINDFSEAGGALDDMSQRTGASVEALSGLGYAAKMSGSSIDSVEKAIRTMGKNLDSAASGGKNARAMLSDLGLTAGQLKALSPEEQFLAVAQSLSEIKDPGQRASEAMKIFGKSGADLVPLLSGGSEGIEELMEQGVALGVVMSGEDASAAATLGDALDQLWTSLSSVSNVIAAALAPLLTDLASKLVSIVGQVMAFIDQNRAMIVVAAQVAAGVAVAGAALLAIAGTAAVVSAALGGLIAVAGFVGTAFAVMGSIIAAVLSPIGLVIGGIAALGVALVYYSGAGGSMVNYLGSTFATLVNFVMPVLDGIKTALMSGQWEAAGKVMFAALEIAFRTGTQSIYALWTDAVVSMQNMWTDFSGIITDKFGGAINWVVSAWESAVNAIAKKLLYLYSLFDRSVDYENAAKGLDADLTKKKKDRESKGFATKDEREAIKRDRLDAAQANKDAFSDRIDELKSGLSSSLAEIQYNAANAPNTPLKDLQSRLPSLGDISSQVEETKASSVTGTFSGFAAGLAGNSVSSFDRMLDESKKTNELLEVVAANTEDLGGDTEFAD
jgi:hypothetical protein